MMSRLITRWLPFLAVAALCLQLALAAPLAAAPEDPVEVKELNFVFVHGAGGSPCRLQPLADCIVDRIPLYVAGYEQANPGTRVRVDTLNRCYADDVDIDTWADNIATTIEERLPGMGSIVLVGHSMGGKAALHAVAGNVGNLADRVVLVVTINSPVRSMDRYQVVGGASLLEYCRARWLRSDRGVCESVAYYDSSEDGRWVGEHRHWLAFTSGENAPLSQQFDYAGFDPYPGDMDDGVLPLSAQYSEGADVVYWGEHGHSDFGIQRELAGFMGGEILRYIFGGFIECSVLARSGSMEHEASGLLGRDYWQDFAGDLLAMSGRLRHWNPFYTRWQEWDDMVEYYPPTYEKDKRSRYQIKRLGSSRLFTNAEAGWVKPDNPGDCRFYVRSSAAPRSSLRVDWDLYRRGLLPVGAERNHYEVKITSGTPLAGISAVSWATGDSRDLRLQIDSWAERPFRWFEAGWRVYSTESRYRKVIDEIPALPQDTSVR